MNLVPARALAALLAWTAGVALHEPVQVVFRWGAERWGVAGLEAREAVVWLGVGVPVYLVCVVAARRRRGPRGAGAWAAWLLAVAAAWATLTQTRAEAVHLPQYALVAALLGWAGARPSAVPLATTVLGAADEAFQALVLYPDRAMGWNDVVLNALGGAAGALGRWTWR